MDLTEIRRLTIVALFADDELLGQLVLKGGNALSLVHRLSTRTSLDLDFSIESDFHDVADARQRIFRTIRDRFDSAGYVVFDESFEPKPELTGADERPWWGGYQLRFKLIDKERYAVLRNKRPKLQVGALVVGPHQERTFTVDFSKYEYTAGKVEAELDHYTIYVYPPAMLAIEKLRAICQQMPAYPLRGRRTPRARDFYDVYLVVTRAGVDFRHPANLELIRHVFAAKRVPLALLDEICFSREFHRPDWPAVIASVPEPVEEFDFYFDFVVDQVARLESPRIEDAPL